ncbi:sugar ABC transporter ATP-binding protein [Notoacmeibacter marinus]|uniref:sugar ABC transporter ATP-binding protein n=1 Tax=Notoacmeibacter marinus TaxID=1876515 RepID=UPI000DF12F78|nr:sugar ABC transporter ATP-binding protein [Notoacmeibacter marinus]
MTSPLPNNPTERIEKPVLSVRDLSKTFGDKTVVRNLTFDLRPGEVLALVGENGAGKSTTKNMLCGLLEPSGGEIEIDGERLDGDAWSAQGISAVHQELSLFGTLGVAENICIANLPGTAMRIDWSEAERIALRQLDFLGIEIDVHSTLDSLGAGKQQIVEIAKALLTADKVLILDEPTTSLTAIEREKLFEIIDVLRARGLAIIFISHFLEEVYRVCETYIVLRDGVQVGAGRLAELPQRQLEQMMVGRTFEDAQLILSDHDDEVALAVENLSSADFDEVSFSVRKGEILGISGLMGAGRTELAEAIFGLRPSEGDVFIYGRHIDPITTDTMKEMSVCYVPEDRRANGLFLNRPVRENLSAAGLSTYIRRVLKGVGFAGESAHATRIVDEMGIAAPHLESDIAHLSGGNQQKTLLGRWFSIDPDILILDEPTKGVDIGAKFDIHARIVELARSGRTIVIVSSDLTELLHLTHRILVMRKGRIVGGLPREEYDAVRIISLAASEQTEGRGT